MQGLRKFNEWVFVAVKMGFWKIGAGSPYIELRIVVRTVRTLGFLEKSSKGIKYDTGHIIHLPENLCFFFPSFLMQVLRTLQSSRLQRDTGNGG